MTQAKEYFNISSEDKVRVQKMFDQDENGIKEDIRILNEWWQKQPHLPQNTDDERLERILLRNKFRVEKTKAKIDNYYTLRGLYPQFFDDIKNNFEAIMESGNHLNMIPSPILTDKSERIIFCRIPKKDAPINWKHSFCYLFLIMEVQMSHDYTVGERFVMDWTNSTLSHYKTIELNLLLNGMAVHQEGYSGRITGVEYINAPSFLDLFLNLFKLVLKQKLLSRFRIHKSLEEMHKCVSLKYLPSDFGGSLKDCDYYHEKIRGVIYEEKDNILKNLELVSNEKLRIGKSKVNNLFGADGTFKKINID